VEPIEGNAADVEDITRLIADVEAGFNGKDAGLLAAHFAHDALVVGASGRRLRGRRDIEADHASRLATVLADQFARYRIEEITFLGPDVAIATVHVQATTRDGAAKDVGHAMRAVFALVRERSRWWIAARRDTLVPD
jgi:uncharacterized protein (TIGR02246 family)